MYQVGGWFGLLDRPKNREPSGFRVPRIVIILGLTSLLTDISSEMVVSVLPVYLVGFLRMSPAQFGLVDGLYQSVAGVVQLAGAFVADRFRRQKDVAVVGYGLSLIARVGLLLTTSATGVTACLTADRLGKGTRSAPRDALISMSVEREHLGTVFGVHRAMDAAGALVGPLLAFVILRRIVNGFDVVFVTSLCAAIAGFAVLVLLVENRRATGDGHSIRLPSPFQALKARGVAGIWRLALAALLLGFLTISDGFIYLALQRRTGLSMGTFPLLYVLTAACYMALAIPVGRLADRRGRFPVFLAGHAVLIGLYISLLTMGTGWAAIGVTVTMLGVYYAATEGALMALGAEILPDSLRTSGLAVLATALAAGRFAGSATLGAVWDRFGMSTAFLAAIAGLVMAIPILAIASARRRSV